MLFATWVTALNILVFAALVAAVIYLFVLIVRALKKYIGSKEMREEKQAVKRTLGETLKAHRTRCQMTQEFEAEALGVSRATAARDLKRAGKTAAPTPAQRICWLWRSCTEWRRRSCCGE